MRLKRTNLATLGLAAVILAGCAGGGDEDYTKVAPSVYQGLYGGTWSSPSLDQRGSLTLEIFASGNFGTQSSMGIEQLQATSVSLQGRVSYNGHFDYDRGDNPERTAVDFGDQGIYELHDGTMTVTPDGRLRGTFVIRSFGQEFPATFEMVRAGG